MYQPSSQIMVSTQCTTTVSVKEGGVQGVEDSFGFTSTGQHVEVRQDDSGFKATEQNAEVRQVRPGFEPSAKDTYTCAGIKMDTRYPRSIEGILRIVTVVSEVGVNNL